MIRTLWIAASGMEAQQLNIDVISNNLANVNTAGYKRGRADFQDLLYETLRPAGAPATTDSMVPTGIQMGHGTRPVAVQKIFLQGDYQHTQGDLDMAIEGDGFFKVLQPNGDTGYTRSGAFKLDKDGRIVTSDGLLMDPQITIPQDSIGISIGTDGTVSVMQANQTQPTEVGVIELARFINPAGLNAIGRNLYLPTEASGDPVLGKAGEEGFGTVTQGYLEMSNVNVVEEMVNMIIAQRAYEINSKAVQAADEMLQMANNVRR